MSKNLLLKFAVGIIASVAAITSTVVPATAQDERWLTMGKSNAGNILSLDVNSVQTKPHSGNWLWFAYRVTTSKETQEYIGYTASCADGKISKEPEWYVDTADRQGVSAEALSIKADFPGSQTLLTKVCQTGNSAQLAFTAASVENQSPNLTSQQHFYLSMVKELLDEKGNPIGMVMSDKRKLEWANMVCDSLKKGVTFTEFGTAMLQEGMDAGMTQDQFRFFSEFVGTVSVAGVNTFCPTYKYQIPR